MVKNLPANAGDAGSIPGSGSSPGEGNGNPLQYFCLGNPIDRRAWQATIYGIINSHLVLSILSDFLVVAGKESTCNVGDPSSVSGSGRSPGEGIGYLLQSSWASLVVQMVKNPPAMW